MGEGGQNCGKRGSTGDWKGAFINHGGETGIEQGRGKGD
jgi:hypothetical protein